MNSRLPTRARGIVSGKQVEHDVRMLGIEPSLVIYGTLAGTVAVGLGYLALRLLGSLGIVVPIAFIVAAGWLADPVLQRVRSSLGGS
jgi:hypothetical protein